MDKDLCFLDKTRIAHEILAYLMDHPDAQDTLEGVMEWWSLERKIKYRTKVVEECLAELVRKGLLLEVKRADSRTHYQVNRLKVNVE